MGIFKGAGILDIAAGVGEDLAEGAGGGLGHGIGIGFDQSGDHKLVLPAVVIELAEGGLDLHHLQLVFFQDPGNLVFQFLHGSVHDTVRNLTHGAAAAAEGQQHGRGEKKG